MIIIIEAHSSISYKNIIVMIFMNIMIILDFYEVCQYKLKLLIYHRSYSKKTLLSSR